MPHISKLLDRHKPISFQQWTSHELASAYVQGFKQEDSTYTSTYGLFNFNVMLFGLEGTPSLFQCRMDQVLRGLEQQLSGAYLDDIASDL